MWQFLFFYIVLSVLGWICFPMAYRYLPLLRDRGYAITRALGLILWAYIFWLLASLQLIPNALGGFLFAFLVLFWINLWILRKIGIFSLIAWVKDNGKYILIVEGIFLLAFLGWSIIRSANPEILGTEKPMELAFINAILRSNTFPPHDPWLSGYAISYYYFGYVMVALLAKLGGISGGVSFNLGISVLFAFSAIGSYSLVYNMLNGRLDADKNSWRSLSLFGPLFVLLMGNLEGFLEVIHARGLFWVRQTNGNWSSIFWQWLDLVELREPPLEPLTWFPNRYYWWWRASRVIQDYDFLGNLKEVINEFPAFSFLLADLHPHVLAMPYALLAMVLILHLYRQSKMNIDDHWSVRFRVPKWFRREDEYENTIPISLRTSFPFFILLSINLGGLAFLNTWDFPFYVALAAGAYAIGCIQNITDTKYRATIVVLFKQFLYLSVILGLVGVGLYFPFYLGFSSQAGGILPNLIYPTRGAHLWVMFAPLFLALIFYLIYLSTKHKTSFIQGFKLSLAIIFSLWVLSILFGLLILAIPQAHQIFLNSLSAPNTADLLRMALSRRLLNNGGWITLLILLAITLTFLTKSVQDYRSTTSSSIEKDIFPDETFPLLLILLGIVLVLVPEFFYLRDQFGWRINTIFKFYFQAWHLWAIVAGYSTAILIRNLRGGWGVVHRIGLFGLLFCGIVYIVLGLWDKTNGFQPVNGWNLDGTHYLWSQSADDMSAVEWLDSHVDFGIIAEAVSYQGGSYSNYARISMLSGLPTILGWIGHESQWRGGGMEIGTRQSDIEQLYCAKEWFDTKQIIDRYHINFIYLGLLERTTYVPSQGNCHVGINDLKFFQHLEPVFQNGTVTIFAVP